MSTRPDQGQDGHQTDEHPDIRFTARGHPALDELAAALTADFTSGLADGSTSAAALDRADIAAVLERVMNADVEDLAAVGLVSKQGPGSATTTSAACRA